jgi:hypothetical protein
MDTSYEIFRDDPLGAVWVESVRDPDRITERLKHLSKANPGTYFAYDIGAAKIVARLCTGAAEGKNAYDLFKEEDNGERIWVETIVGLQNLKKRLKALSAMKPGTYLIYDPTEARFIKPFRKSA